jgi:IclR family KDG regulon transcriptional repressor
MAIQSLKRACKILSLFSLEKPRWGVSEIAKAIDLPITTASSLIRTLKGEGFLDQDPETRRYSLGSNIFTLGIIVSETLEINQKAQEQAHQLAEKTGLICRVAIWDHDAALVTLDITPRDAEFLARRLGPRVVAYCSSIGRALLAYLEPRETEGYLKKTKLTPFTPHTITRRDHLRKELKKIRSFGYAVNNQELSIGRASLAVPIFRRGGSVTASISVVGSPERVLESDFENLVASIKNTAEGISWQMGYRPESPAMNIGLSP